jgi:hypothetical protein
MEKHGLCGKQNQEEKSGDVDDCAAQHDAKPHGKRLQRHPNAGHGIAHEVDIIGQRVHQRRLQ